MAQKSSLGSFIFHHTLAIEFMNQNCTTLAWPNICCVDHVYVYARRLG
jgi:hypothetical protein